MPSAHAAASDTGTDWLTLLLSYWWVFLLFGGAILEWIGETFDVGLSALHRRSKLKHKRKLAALRLELQIAQAKAGTQTPALAGALPAAPCRHRNVAGVRDRADNVVAWLCKGCETQLPADFSVYEEDL
jgi:hypothetical protein